MPLTAASASLIGAGIAATSQGVNAAATGRMNRRTMLENRRVYEQQRKDALTDWERNNAYNSPQAQMQRLQEAGLNPNLVYGTGSATQNTPPPAHVDYKAHQYREPSFDGAQIANQVNQYFDTKIKQAQYDNLMTDNTVKEAQRLEILSRTARSDFDLNFERGLESVSADARRAALVAMQTNTALALNADERAYIAQQWDIAKSIETIATMRLQRNATTLGMENTKAATRKIHQEIENLKKDGELKELDTELKRTGVQPTDQLWQRIIARHADDVLKGIKNADDPDYYLNSMTRYPLNRPFRKKRGEGGSGW